MIDELFTATRHATFHMTGGVIIMAEMFDDDFRRIAEELKALKSRSGCVFTETKSIYGEPIVIDLAKIMYITGEMDPPEYSDDPTYIEF